MIEVALEARSVTKCTARPEARCSLWMGSR
jgi:hypothetical protein